MRPVVLGLFLAVGAAMVPITGRAESARAITCSLRAPTGIVPSNAPALVLQNYTYGRDIASASLSLTPSPAGVDKPWALVPDDVAPTEAWLARTKQPIPEGEYDAEVGLACVGDQDGGIAPPGNTGRFKVVAPAALPTSMGTGTAIGTGMIELRPSPELAAYLSLTRLEAHVAGAPVRTWTYGQVQTTIFVSAPPGACPSNAPDAAPIQVPVELRAHVAGASTDPPPLVVNALVECASPVQMPRDASADDPQGGSFTTGGCTMPVAPPALPSAGTLGLAVLVLFRRVRRRDRRT